MSDYIEFVLFGKKPKTEVYVVNNIKSGCMLGMIRWHGPWRQYIFSPVAETIFNMDCMRYIIDFIKELMEARKG